ncbi:hypothetical protein CDAR_437211 [Caerostris darwini]|uniref:Uncharacterized protein n=1 Tax=Caerostris darwini TaxID=1538125 RepID=A0AAV4TSF5_9ARAC|nr:hypothetical protein CDAR_437211 [Caerostris darwini]
MDPTADLDSAACNSRPFGSIQFSAAAEAMLTEPPMLPLMPITAPTSLRARAQLKDKEKAVDLIRQILQNQNILIDEESFSGLPLNPPWTD